MSLLKTTIIYMKFICICVKHVSSTYKTHSTYIHHTLKKTQKVEFGCYIFIFLYQLAEIFTKWLPWHLLGDIHDNQIICFHLLGLTERNKKESWWKKWNFSPVHCLFFACFTSKIQRDRDGVLDKYLVNIVVGIWDPKHTMKTLKNVDHHIAPQIHVRRITSNKN